VVLRWLFAADDETLMEYGGIAKSTLRTISRKITQLELEGADRYFGHPPFQVEDFIEKNEQGLGVVNILYLADIREKPLLFSTFIMWLVSQLLLKLPEVGDLELPRLVFFFDEAHLLFEGANRTLVREVERAVKMIRSKGVGTFFATQNPTDIAESVLSQLGSRIQHSLRALTPQDEAKIRQLARTFRKTPFYDLEATLTSMGSGVALVSVLDKDGVPTIPLVVKCFPPASSTIPLSHERLIELELENDLIRKYRLGTPDISAAEILRDLEKERLARLKPVAGYRRVRKEPIESAVGIFLKTAAREVAKQASKRLFATYRPSRTERFKNRKKVRN